MPPPPDIRWKQRFQSFERAFALLKESTASGASALNPLEKEGVVQRFEYSLELACNLMKDFLEHGGTIISPRTPRQVIKEAFSAGVVSDGQVWIDMIDHRNLLSHTHDATVFDEAVGALLSRYLPKFEQLHNFFTEQSKR